MKRLNITIKTSRLNDNKVSNYINKTRSTMHFFSRKQEVLGLIGSYLLPLFPKKTNQLKNKNFTLSDSKGYDRLDQVLKLGLIYNIIKSKKSEELASYHLNYWQSDNATLYHQQA